MQLEQGCEGYPRSVPVPSLSRREWSVLIVTTVGGLFLGALAGLMPDSAFRLTIGAMGGVAMGVAAVAGVRVRRISRAIDERSRLRDAKLAASVDRLSKIVSDIYNGLARLEARADTMSDRLEGADRAMTHLTSVVEDAIDSIEANHRHSSERLTVLTDEIITRSSERDLRTAENRFVRLHRIHALSEAYRLSAGEYPDRLLLLMTIERSGSTALFDLLRSHPNTYFEPRSFIWEALGLKGRRYPSSLSDRGRYTTPVEVQPGVGAYIPILDIDSQENESTSSVAIEKAHPQFIDHDWRKLLHRIEALQDRGVGIKFLIQVRDPLEVMWSMAEYKQREPAWYTDLQEGDIPEYVRRSFQTLTEFEHRIPGAQIVDHTDLLTVSPALISLLEELGPLGSNDMSLWAKHILDQLQAMQSKTPFIAERDPLRGEAGPHGIWTDSRTVVSQAISLWKELTTDSDR